MKPPNKSAVILVLFGVSTALFIAPNFRLLMGHAKSGDEGVISALTMTVRNFGSTMGVALFSTVFIIATGFASGNAGVTDPNGNAAFHADFLLGCIIATNASSCFIHCAMRCSTAFVRSGLLGFSFNVSNL